MTPDDAPSPDAPSAGSRPRRTFGLSGKILLGIVLGLATGLFFGPLCAPLGIVGRAFIGLLQMTVLPYICVALVANVGRLSFASGKKLFLRGGLVLLVIWGLGLAAITVMSLAFPVRDVGAFYSVAAVERPPPPDFLSIFIPFNVFDALVREAVPAVVVFSLFLGAALIGVEKKGPLLATLDGITAALMRVNLLVARLTPVGVFAMIAAAAGTMTLEELGRVQGYLVAQTLLCLILAFWALPSLVAALTPFTYREVFRASRSALLTAFATGKVLIVLPMLIDETKKLFDKKAREAGTADADSTNGTIDVLYPLAYPFPHLGKLSGLLFLPFAAWFLGTPLALHRFPVFLFAGLTSYFGGPIAATPFLLDLMHLPADMMQLFLISGIWAARFGDLLGVMHFLALTILTTASLIGILRVRWRPLLRSGLVTVGLFAVALAGTRAWLVSTSADLQGKDDVLAALNSFEPEAPFEVLAADAPAPPPLAPGQSRLDRARASGVLRVGVDVKRRPYVFRNPVGVLVGFDVELALVLAEDAGLRIAFVPLGIDAVPEALANDRIDLALGGLVATLDRAAAISISDPYGRAHPALLVPDETAGHFTSLEVLAAREDLVLAYADPTFGTTLRRVLPRARFVAVDAIGPALGAIEEGDLEVDGLVTSAEAGSAWTLVHPRFAVVVPKGVRGDRPVVVGLPRDDEALRKFVDLWIGLKETDGTLERLFDHWIRGKVATPHGPRWSVIRDVLGWVD